MQPQRHTCPMLCITRLISQLNVCLSHVATCEKLLAATYMEWSQHYIVVIFKCVDSLFPCITLANGSAVQIRTYIPFSQHHSQQYHVRILLLGFFPWMSIFGLNK